MQPLDAVKVSSEWRDYLVIRKGINKNGHLRSGVTIVALN
jgi:hypothetical protein